MKCSDTLMLVVRVPRTEIAHDDAQTRTARRTLPEVCVGAFKAELDYMLEGSKWVKEALWGMHW